MSFAQREKVFFFEHINKIQRLLQEGNVSECYFDNSTLHLFVDLKTHSAVVALQKELGVLYAAQGRKECNLQVLSLKENLLPTTAKLIYPLPPQMSLLL